MGRFRKTFKEALDYSQELINSKNMTKEKAAKKAALMYGENEEQLLTSLNGERLHHKDLNNESSEKTENTKTVKTTNANNTKKTSTQKKSTKKAASSVSNEGESLKKFEYNGPVDIICLNGNVSTINICELVSGIDTNDAKEHLYEKLFNNRLPIFIRKSNWSKCLHEV